MWVVLALVAGLVDGLLLQNSNRWVKRRAWLRVGQERRFTPAWPPNVGAADDYRGEMPRDRAVPRLSKNELRIEGDDAVLSAATPTSWAMRRRRSFFAGKYVPYFVCIEASRDDDEIVLRARHAAPLGPLLLGLAIVLGDGLGEATARWLVAGCFVAITAIGFTAGGDRRERAVVRALDLLESEMSAAIAQGVALEAR